MKQVQKDILDCKRAATGKQENKSQLNVKESAVLENKQIKVLENRLDKANQKFNEVLGNNKSLRLEIDNIRKEKVIFETLYSKLETELVRKKHQVNDVIEVASGAYEERNKIQAKMAELIQQSQKEQ